jgi:hypothetical protein
MLLKRNPPLRFAAGQAHARKEDAAMTNPFDASFAFTGAVSAEVEAAIAREVDHCMGMPGKLANAKLHANNELTRWVLACNRLVWGEMPAQARQPAPTEITALLAQLSPENKERLLKESRLAAEQRHLVAALEAAEIEAHARLAAQRADEARAEADPRAQHEAMHAEAQRAAADRALREEFEAVDAAGKEARFQAWRTKR